jgi:superfamily I DNA/RNA helicase
VNPKHIEAINSFERGKKRGKLTDIEEMKLKTLVKGNIDLTKPWFEVLDIPNDLMAYYRDLIRYKVDVSKSCGLVNTIHGVKGGEADNVVLMLDFTKAVRKSLERNPDSELRCLYVACTRAKKRLHIVHSSSKNGYDDLIRMGT